mgnify:CR=1 FL=1
MRSSICFCPGSSVAAYTMSTQAWSMAIGTSEAMMPMSAMQGFSATAQQSQSTDRLFIQLKKTALPAQRLDTDGDDYAIDPRLRD